MLNYFFKKITKNKNIFKKNSEIFPEDIFLDSKNLPEFDKNQFEGRLEKPISGKTFLGVGMVFFIIMIVFVGKLWSLQIIQGKAYSTISENNRLEHSLIFANRGIIYDRNKIELATNSIKPDGSDFAERKYIDLSGMAHVVGYVKYPQKDKSGFYYNENFVGKDGAEKQFNDILSGKNGLKITETDAHYNIKSESVIQPPQDGHDVVLSIDSKMQHKMYEAIKKTAEDNGFTGGAGIVMDVNTGEILSLVSFPEYDQNVVTKGENIALINKFLSDSVHKVFLNRAISGLYTPGSIVKPIIALGALNENIISPDKKILSTGSISIQNPYFKDQKTIFNDWRVNGWTDMREALAVSSDVYFYEIGGGYNDQKGLGILNLEKYFKLFGFGEPTGIDLQGENSGIIPSPEWKEKNFNGDPWRIGDTYHTSIGQYGLQVTPLEALRAIASIANNGKMVTPSIVFGGDRSNETTERKVDLNQNYFQIVRDGMRDAVTFGTAVGLNIPNVEIAAKTGTAELGISKADVNSWSVGFWPYKNPKYAFVVVMEKGSRDNVVGATSVMRQLFDWMVVSAPNYLQNNP